MNRCSLLAAVRLRSLQVEETGNETRPLLCSQDPDRENHGWPFFVTLASRNQCGLTVPSGAGLHPAISL